MQNNTPDFVKRRRLNDEKTLKFGKAEAEVASLIMPFGQASICKCL